MHKIFFIYIRVQHMCFKKVANSSPFYIYIFIKIYDLYVRSKQANTAFSTRCCKEKNFFKTRVTNYQTGGALSW